MAKLDTIKKIVGNRNKIDEAEYRVVGGPTASEPLKNKLDYAADVKPAKVPTAPGSTNGPLETPKVGTIGSDDADENDPITVVLDDDDADDDKIHEDFATWLAKLSEDEDEPKVTLPDVDSKLEDPDELATEAPGAAEPNEENDEVKHNEGDNDGDDDPTITLPDVDSKLEDPDELATSAPGAKTPNAVSEDINAIFQGVELSEAGKAKATAVFKSAVKRQVAEEKTRVQKIASNKLKEAFGYLKARYDKKLVTEGTKLTKQVDEYLNYAVGEWMNENRLVVEKGIRAELAESFISGLKTLFVEHCIEIPESKVDVVETLGKKVSTLEAKLNETVQSNIKLKGTLNNYRKEFVVREVSEGLSDVQKDRMKKLSEGVEFTTKGEYQSQLLALKESYFPFKKAVVNVPNNEPIHIKEEVVTKPATTAPTTVINESTDPLINAAREILSKRN